MHFLRSALLCLLSLVVFLAMFMDSSTSYHVLPTGNFPMAKFNEQRRRSPTLKTVNYRLESFWRVQGQQMITTLVGHGETWYMFILFRYNTYIYIFILIRIHTIIHLYMHSYLNTHIYIYIHLYIPIYTCTYWSILFLILIHTYLYVYLLLWYILMYTFIYLYVLTYIYT